MLHILGLAVGCVSLVFYVIGIAIPYWLHKSVEGQTYNIGLWLICYHSRKKQYSQCLEISAGLVVDAPKATRALEILALLVLAAALGCYLLKLCVMKEQNMLPKIGASLGCVSGTFGIIGCDVYVAKYKKDYALTEVLDLHAGFALCILAAVGAYISSVLLVLNRQR